MALHRALLRLIKLYIISQLSTFFLNGRTSKGLLTDAKLQSTDILNPNLSPTVQGRQLVQGHFQVFLEYNRLSSVSFLGQGPYFVFTYFNTTGAAKASEGHLQ